MSERRSDSDADEPKTALQAVLGLDAPPLEPGGPPVSREILERFLDHDLAPAAQRMVLQYVSRYLAWSAALVQLRACVPTAIGPAVDAGLMTAFRRQDLSKDDEVQVRRNIRLFRNWYDAANE
jgi:hypothetical protein